MDNHSAIIYTRLATGVVGKMKSQLRALLGGQPVNRFIAAFLAEAVSHISSLNGSPLWGRT